MVEVLKQAGVGKAESEQDATYCLVASTTYHSQTKYGGGECKNKEKNFFLNKICLFGYSLLYQPGATQWQRGRYIPNAPERPGKSRESREISRGRGFCTPRPEGNPDEDI